MKSLSHQKVLQVLLSHALCSFQKRALAESPSMDIGSVEEKLREPELVERADNSSSEEVMRVRVEAALREGEKKYRTLFDSIDNAITVLEVLYDERGVASDLRFV